MTGRISGAVLATAVGVTAVVLAANGDSGTGQLPLRTAAASARATAASARTTSVATPAQTPTPSSTVTTAPSAAVSAAPTVSASPSPSPSPASRSAAAVRTPNDAASEPSSVVVSAVRGRVLVHWFSPLFNGGGVTGYVITRSGDGPDVTVSTSGTSDALGYLSWIDTHVVTGATYTYTIGALSAGGAGPTVSQTVTVPTSEVIVKGDHGLYAVGAEGLPVPIITDAEDYFWSPSVSPDGRLLAFARGVGAGIQPDIFVMPVEGGTPRRLTSSRNSDVDPAWSPDGRFLAYTSISGTGSSIWKMPAAGGEPVKVADSASQPTWLGADGTLVAVDDSVSNGSLVVLQGGTRSVIPGTAGAIEPVVSPNGNWLAFSYWHNDIEQHSLVVIPTHDGDGVELSGPTVDVTSPTWLPDGTGLLFDLREQGRGSKPAAGRFTTAPDITDLVYLTDQYGYTNPVYASTAPTPPRMQPWGATGLRHNGSFGAVHTKVAARRW